MEFVTDLDAAAKSGLTPGQKRALAIKRLGWCPLPLPANRKHSSPAGTTGGEGRDFYEDDIISNRLPDGTKRKRLWDGNLATRMPEGGFGFDIDEYDHPGAKEELLRRAGKHREEFEQALETTWISTGRGLDGLPSAIYLFRVPPGLKLTDPPDGVDYIQRHHRYVVIHPSKVSDEKADRAYLWWSPGPDRKPHKRPPPFSDIPRLSPEIIAALKRPSPRTRRSNYDPPPIVRSKDGYMGKWEIGTAIKGEAQYAVVSSIAAALVAGGRTVPEAIAWMVENVLKAGYLPDQDPARPWTEGDMALRVERAAQHLRDNPRPNTPPPPPEPEWGEGETIPVGKRRDTVAAIAAWRASQSASREEVEDYLVVKVWPQIEQPKNDRYAKGDLRNAATIAWKSRKAAEKEAAAKKELPPVAVVAAEMDIDFPTATDKARRLYAYNKLTGYWEDGAEDAVQRKLREIYGDEDYTPYLGEAVTKILLNAKPLIDLSNTTRRVALHNGTLNLNDPDNPVLEDHAPGNYLMTALPVHYDPKANCPTWDWYLRESIPDPEERLLLQQAVGTMLVDETPPKGSIVWIGRRDTGKTTGTNVITALIGDANTCALSPQDLNRDKHASADLFGKKANIVSDIPVDAWKDPAVWKQVVGQDWIRANPKHKSRFSFRVTATTLMTGNTLPVSYDRTGAVRSRLFIIHGRKDEISADDRDGHLERKLLRERPGILNWAIAGLAVVQNNGWIWKAPTGAETEQETLHLLDNPHISWAEDHTQEAEGAFLPKSGAAKSYQEWLRGQGYLNPGGQDEPAQQLSQADRTRFFNALDELWGQKRVRRGRRGGWGWEGRQLLT